MKATPHLGCLLLCDLANSTKLIETLGDSKAAQLIRRHDQLARETLHRFHGQEIDKTDGFLVLFERPVEAVAFALEYQTMLAKLGEQAGQPLAARVGIHVGEILSWRNSAEDIAQGAKPVEIEGLAKAIAARLMGLARSGQILLSESAYTLAHRAREELAEHQRLRWISHGDYRLHGVSRRMSVFEVGLANIAPLSPPQSKAKAKRIVAWWQWKPLYIVLFVAIGSILAHVVLRPQPAIAFAERDWVVLADFVNRSGNQKIDDSLNTALRIGLEQSRHLNIVPRSRSRELLQMMRRSPDDVVDRELSIQLAERTSARAVVVPSITELGGRLRLTTEVVEPASGVTVLTHSTESRSESQLLAGLDQLIAQLREDLGETSAAIEAPGQNLADVTTSDLEALRAYAQAVKSKNLSRFEEARELLSFALERDPEFAMAISLSAALEWIQGKQEAALAEANRALSLNSRLSARESLGLRARASFYAGEDSRPKWDALLSLYPDDFSAAEFLAWTVLERSNDVGRALQILSPALKPSNPRLPNLQYFRATLLATQDQLTAALQQFAEAKSGIGGDVSHYALALSLAGRPDQALKTLDQFPGASEQPVGVANELARVAVLLQKNETTRALALARSIGDNLKASDPKSLSTAIAVNVLPCSLGLSEPAAPWPEMISAVASLPAKSLRSSNRRAHSQAWLAWAIARCGNKDTPRELLQGAERNLSGTEFGAALSRLAEAEIMAANNQLEAATALLSELDPMRDLPLSFVLRHRLSSNTSTESISPASAVFVYADSLPGMALVTIAELQASRVRATNTRADSE